MYGRLRGGNISVDRGSQRSRGSRFRDHRAESCIASTIGTAAGATKAAPHQCGGDKIPSVGTSSRKPGSTGLDFSTTMRLSSTAHAARFHLGVSISTATWSVVLAQSERPLKGRNLNRVGAFSYTCSRRKVHVHRLRPAAACSRISNVMMRETRSRLSWKSQKQIGALLVRYQVSGTHRGGLRDSPPLSFRW